MGGELQNLLLLTSPFGDDTLPVQQGTLHAIGLEAFERLGQPFEIGVDVVSTRQGLSPASLLNQPVAVTVRRKDGIDRVFNGIVRQVESVGTEQRGRWHYHLELVPRLWFLSQSADCRIFQCKTAVEILQQIFSEHEVSPVEFRVSGAQAQREYTTQFNEDDLAFCHRLMQESGLYYYFEHSKQQHRMIVTDVNQSFRKMQQPVHRVIWLGENVDIFDRWLSSAGVSAGSVSLQDYDPERPASPVSGMQTARDAGPGASGRQVHRWPAMTKNNPVAKDRARYQTEAASAAAALCRGHGYDPNLCPGFRFELAQDPVTGADGVDYAIQEARHSARDESWVGGGVPTSYDCYFACFEQTVPWREPLSLPRPSMPGIFSAIVLGEGGEEIHADRLGRVKVRPLFDHRQDTVASMAIWVRILNAWSGDKWGWQHLPRVGTEVGISFMSGDCDNPVVIGCFYHEQMPPVFDVPGEQTKQGFRSRSTLRGGPQDYNELSFDDRLGQEMLLVHAQKDHNLEVEHDQTDMIGNDRSVTTRRNDTLTSQTGEIAMSADMGGVTISAARTIILRCGASTITMTPASISIVSPDINLVSEGAILANAAADIEIAAGGAMELVAGGELDLTGGGSVTIETADPMGVVCLPFPI